jgi:chromosomal replication initiator protein
LNFTRFVATSENRSALEAVRQAAVCLASPQERLTANPLYLHGPTGTGKTHLVSALLEEATRLSPQVVITLLQAGDWEGTEPLQEARHSDLLVIEDLQHLGTRSRSSSTAVLEAFVQILDHLYARGRQMIFTANTGPAQLSRLPSRLTSRLASGLIVRLEPLSVPSRLAVLQDKAQRRRLDLGPDLLAWLAEHLTGGVREMEGALIQLELLLRDYGQPLDVATVAVHFQPQVDGGRATVERIVQRVGSYFRVEPRRMQSRERFPNVLLPRQVGMYLARQLTGMSLEEIGAYFGGRDHSTVLHACRKIEDALVQDAGLCGAVQQLHADLR